MFELTPFGRRNHLNVYDPFKEMENFEKSFFGDFDHMFRTDIRETDKTFELSADLPGMNKDDINVDIDGDRMTISAQRSSEFEEKDDKNHGYVRRERSYGSYSRSFDISNIKADEITGSYENGVLKLIMPKKDKSTPASRRIQLN